jgi:cytochrome c
LLACTTALAQERFPGIGRGATPAEIAAWDIDVRPDFKGLPRGAGSVKQGEEIWEAKCAACHGSFGESNAFFPPVAGGTTADDVARGRVAALAKPGEQRTTLMKLSQVSTLWDYINRAMPWNAPRTLAADEVYALTAYILSLGRIVPDDFVLSERNIAEVQKRLPNRDGMMPYPALWDVRGKGDVRNVACMKDCPAGGRITSRLPDAARGAHGNLAEQNRPIGPVRGLATGPIAAAAPAQAADPARALAEKSGCLACHGARQRLVGPSLAEIGARYRGDGGAEQRLVGKVQAGGQGVWGAVPMPPHPNLSEGEIRALVRWVLSSQ